MSRVLMSIIKNTQLAFLKLLAAGLWEKTVQLSAYEGIDFKEIYRLAEEQSVIGLAAAGIEHIEDIQPPKEEVLTFVGTALQIEQRNAAMNEFASWLILLLRNANIFTILIKGQGVAQCYTRPLWRSAGDIDLLFNSEDYDKAKYVLYSISDGIGSENIYTKHQPLIIKGFEVELHGMMPFTLSRKAEKVLEDVTKGSLGRGDVRTCIINEKDIFLPKVDNDIIIIFTHFLQHFFIEGVGLRQICDWCRLLWTYRASINKSLLKERLRAMRLLTEWRVFASLAVDYLSMPDYAMPFYKKSSIYRVKGKKTLDRILNCGNFGHNNDHGYRSKYSKQTAKYITFFRRFFDFGSLMLIFPLDAPRFFVTYATRKAKRK